MTSITSKSVEDSKDYLFLLPQRKFKEFLKSSAHRHLLEDELSMEGDELDTASASIFSVDNQSVGMPRVHNIFIKPRKVNYFDLVVKSKDTLMLQHTCEFLFIHEVCIVSILCKSYYVKITSSHFALRFSINDFVNLISKETLIADFLGIVKHKTIYCGQEGENIGLDNCIILSTFFNSQLSASLPRFECSIRSLTTQFDTTVNDISICQFIASFQNCVGSTLHHINFEGMTV